MNPTTRAERVETVILGGGQAGLAMGYQLKRRQRPFVILDAHARVGDAWRQRWDSLRLFTPAQLSHLPGLPLQDGGWTFATKDEFAEYLEAYVAKFSLDVRNDARVDGISRHGGGYVVSAGDRQFEADHVVLATGGYQVPKVPVFAPELNPATVQLHSAAYRNAGQLQPGPVLIVGVGNSGAEIAMELAKDHEVVLAGRAGAVFPVRPTSLAARVFMPTFLFVASRLLTSSTPMGRRMRRNAQHAAAPLIRIKPGDLEAAGVRRVGRIAGIRDGRPYLEDGVIIEVANVIWCTGFESDFSWIDLPAFAAGSEPAHVRGVLSDEPGMYLVGQRFQHALASTFIAGVGRDADHIAGVIEKRAQRARGIAEQRGASDPSPVSR